jgi:hypothetical protein
VRNSLYVRELLGIDFPKVPNCIYRDLRLLVLSVVEAQKGSREAEGLLSKEGAHFLSWERHVGNKGL